MNQLLYNSFLFLTLGISSGIGGNGAGGGCEHCVVHIGGSGVTGVSKRSRLFL